MVLIEITMLHWSLNCCHAPNVRGIFTVSLVQVLPHLSRFVSVWVMQWYLNVSDADFINIFSIDIQCVIFQRYCCSVPEQCFVINAARVRTAYLSGLFLTWISSWIGNYSHYKMWDEITYPFPNFNGVTIEVWEWISNFIPHITGHVITYPCWD